MHGAKLAASNVFETYLLELAEIVGGSQALASSSAASSVHPLWSFGRGVALLQRDEGNHFVSLSKAAGFVISLGSSEDNQSLLFIGLLEACIDRDHVE